MITKIPYNKDRVFIELMGFDGTDLDLRLRTSGGVTLVQYSPISVHWSFTTSTTFVHNGMTIQACVDGCQDDRTITMHDNTQVLAQHDHHAR